MKSVRNRLESLEKTARPDWAADVLARKRAWAESPEGRDWREQVGRLMSDFTAVWVRPEFHTPPGEVRRRAEAHVRHEVEQWRCLGLEEDPADTARMIESLAEWACNLTADEWCDCLIRAGYADVYPDRLSRAVDPNGATQ